MLIACGCGTPSYGLRARPEPHLLRRYSSCIDAPRSPHLTSFSSNPPFQLSLSTAGGVPVTSYVGSTTYTLKLAATSATPFGGWILSGFRGTQASVGTAFTATAKAGVISPTDGMARQMSGQCASGVTHTDPSAKSLLTLSWAAPAAGSGTVTFLGVIVQVGGMMWL